MKALNKFALLIISLLSVFFLNSCKKDIALSGTKVPPAGAVAQQVADGRMILFPGRGWVPASRVHLIERGAYLMRKNGHIFKVKKGTDEIIEDFGEVPESKPSTSTNVNKTIADNSTIKSGIVLNNKFSGPKASGVNANWATYAHWQNPNHSSPINYFSTTWTVPGPPDSVANQSIAIFNGLSDTTNAGDIIQPVLSWGPAYGWSGGNFWGVSNSYAAGNSFYAQTAIDTVYSGQAIRGYIKYNGKKVDGSYNYTSAFAGFTDSLVLVEGNTYFKSNNIAPFIPELNLAYETLETYSVGSGEIPQHANEYPEEDSIRLTSINLKVGSSNPTLTWTCTNGTYAAPGQKTVAVNTNNPNGEVDIYFHANQRPIISFPAPDSIGLTKNVLAAPVTPTNSGGEATFSINPTLPSGLVINSSNGTISGTPTVTSAKATYTETATNYAGTSHATISIRVWPAPVLTDSYQGHGDLYAFAVTPNIPSPSTGVMYWKDLTNGTNNESAGSPYGFSESFTYGHQYQVYFIEYGTGLPARAQSNTVTFTAQ